MKTSALCHRVGFGFDSHVFGRRGTLRLGGLRFVGTPALHGHSDGDAVLHAVIDALLGAAGLGDIGDMFPDTAAAWKGASSRALLARALGAIREAGYRPSSIDIVVLANKPKLGAAKEKMRRALARDLKLVPALVNVKAKTQEGLSLFRSRHRRVGGSDGRAAMKQILLHNTLTGRKELFVPMVPGKVGMYVCGITPYDETHLGHGRAYVVFDLLKRALRRFGYKINHIQNFTDVDDKIIARAAERGQPPEAYVEPFIRSFHDLMKRLNVLPADVYPRVTTHMDEIRAMVTTLVERGLAYELDGSVFFSVRAFPAYGRLSKRNLEELESGARVEVNERKRDPLDFALWKKAKPGEPSWPSPWGDGRPGWHIECSAMSTKYLGPEFDLHGGGMDLIFPHHENEIAQSVGALGHGFARAWVHNGFVEVNKQKMSKSLGNFFTLKDILAKFDPMVVRYFLLAQHYRSPLNFSDVDMAAIETPWRQRLGEAHRIAKEWHDRLIAVRAAGADDSAPYQSIVDEFNDALADDLNTPEALAAVHRLAGRIYQQHAEGSFASDGEAAGRIGDPWPALSGMLDTLGLVPASEETWDEELLDLAKQRQEARQRKDWPASDRIREALKARGVTVEDTTQGPRLKRLSS